MRAPGFWYRRTGLMAQLLRPLGAVYAAGTARRLQSGARTRIGVPVICVGNLNAGGTGKTPVVMALADRLRDRVGIRIVSRGYGGALQGPVRVDPAHHDAAAVGDEPLLLSTIAPVWVAKDRAAGARTALADGAGLILLDDGFQDGSLALDLAIVVVDAERGFGNGQVIPAGPLREPVATGLSRADLVISIGADVAQDAFAARWGSHINAPHLRAELRPLATGLPLDGARVVAFAGIGDPEKFFTTLRGLGADILRAIPLADHQALGPALLTRIERQAKAEGAMLVTTEKDAVRLPPAFRNKVTTLPVRLEFSDEAAISDILNKLVPGH